MKPTLFQNKISVKKSSLHGYGVFAETDIAPNELIEECHTVLTPREKALNNYYFSTGKKDDYVIAFGYGCIYNHSDQPNARFTFNTAHSVLEFRAEKWIRKDEEILVSYGNDWFSDRYLVPKALPFWQTIHMIFSPIYSIILRGFIVVGVVVLAGYFLPRLL